MVLPRWSRLDTGHDQALGERGHADVRAISMTSRRTRPASSGTGEVGGAASKRAASAERADAAASKTQKEASNGSPEQSRRQAAAPTAERTDVERCRRNKSEHTALEDVTNPRCVRQLRRRGALRTPA
jgi:hypothetical protein